MMDDNITLPKEDVNILKPLAFKSLSQVGRNENLEEVINDNISLGDDSHSYDDLDFVLAREFSGPIREDNGVKMVTLYIVQTYKKCRNDFFFEDTMKPRRELTIPSEGTDIMLTLGVYNEGLDNKEFDLIVFVNDVISSPENNYVIIDIIGKNNKN
jgi:hypothetical protein